MLYFRGIKRGGRRYKLKLHVIRNPQGKVVLRVNGVSVRPAGAKAIKFLQNGSYALLQRGRAA